jgi:hypothetical protein
MSYMQRLSARWICDRTILLDDKHLEKLERADVQLDK